MGARKFVGKGVGFGFGVGCGVGVGWGFGGGPLGFAGMGAGGGCGVGLGLGWGFGAAIGSQYIKVDPDFAEVKERKQNVGKEVQRQLSKLFGKKPEQRTSQTVSN